MTPQRTVVIVPAPTANGDLHVGHLCGPFLAGDVFARQLRASGHGTLFATGIQESQTYVVSTARRLGVSPEQLSQQSWSQVQRTLSVLGISVDGFAPGDARFQKLLLDFLTRLRDAGRLRLRTMTFPYSERTGEFLVDGYVRGACPVCLASSCGGVCESCGHPNNPGELLEPQSTADPTEQLTTREAEVLVLPLEDYREQLLAYFDRPGRVARPHMMQAVREMLQRPLPDFPVTYPINWGIPVPFPEVAGQVVNPAAEAMPAGMCSSAVAAERQGIILNSDDELWLAGSGTRVVYFCGFDNTQPFAIAGLALLMARGDRYVLPEALLTNEFYELDYEKFSTSRGHVVWAHELAGELPRDGIRFFLASTSPEFQRTNFNRHALGTVVQSRLVEPWNRIATTVNTWLDGQRDGWAGQPLPVSDRSRTAAATMAERFAAQTALSTFSLNRLAELIGEQLARLEELAAGVPPAEDPPARLADLCYQVEAFLRCAGPVLIDLTNRVLGEDAAEVPAVPAVPANGGRHREAGARQVLVRRMPLLARVDDAEPVLTAAGRAG